MHRVTDEIDLHLSVVAMTDVLGSTDVPAEKVDSTTTAPATASTNQNSQSSNNNNKHRNHGHPMPEGAPIRRLVTPRRVEHDIEERIARQPARATRNPRQSTDHEIKQLGHPLAAAAAHILRRWTLAQRPALAPDRSCLALRADDLVFQPAKQGSQP